MKETTPEWLGRIQLFKSCTETELQQIAKLLIPKSVDKREILFYEGEPCDVIYFIHSGRVKTYKTTEDGREQILNILTEGDMLPHVGLFGKASYPATASALDDCELSIMYVQPFMQFLSQFPSITVKLLQDIDQKMRDLQFRLSNVLSRDMTEKVSNVLIDLAKRKGVKTDQGYRLDIDLTHQDIANMVGTTRETVSRILSQLKKENKVHFESEAIIINKEMET